MLNRCRGDSQFHEGELQLALLRGAHCSEQHISLQQVLRSRTAALTYHCIIVASPFYHHLRRRSVEAAQFRPNGHLGRFLRCQLARGLFGGCDGYGGFS